MPATEHVVLLDELGRPIGTMPKGDAHSATTPLHLAFSCYVVHPTRGVLLTRRAATKRTWPGVWSNACCGHPQLGETLEQAVVRRVDEELGLRVRRVDVVLPDFVYRAEMPDGTVEHELCPVVVADVAGTLHLDPTEVDDVAWMSWRALHARAVCEPSTLSPWSVAQIAALHEAGWVPGESADPSPRCHERAARCDATVDPMAAVRRALDPVLRSFVDGRSAALRAIDPALAPVADEICALVAAGGKRLRPAFLHWGHRAAGGMDDVTPLGGAIELLHTFALLHDDVMDRSARRRGRDAAHVSFAKRHAADGLLGDGDRFGTSAAMLAGDLAFVWADELLETAEIPAPALAAVRVVFSAMRTEVMAGQYLDLAHAAAPDADEHGARRVALLKSARYTVTQPLLLGAAAAGADAAATVRPALMAYGDAIGTAFQLRDDVLGLFGDPGVTGKSAMDDLREGKRTLLALRALRLATPAQRAVLEDALGDPLLDEERADAARRAIAGSGALASVERLIDAEHARAVGALAAIPEPARQALHALADAAIRRDR